MSVFPVATKMRVAAPIPSIVLRLVEHGEQPDQSRAIKACCNAEAASLGQDHIDARILALRLYCRNTIDQFNWHQIEIGDRGLPGIGMLATQLAIVIQACTGKTVLLAKCLARQAALFILKCQAESFTAAPPPTSCKRDDLIHGSSESPRHASRKKVVAGTATLDRQSAGTGFRRLKLQ